MKESIANYILREYFIKANFRAPENTLQYKYVCTHSRYQDNLYV